MFVWSACRSVHAHSRNDHFLALHKCLTNDESFVTFIVKSIGIVCPTESFIELPVFVLGFKLFAFYRIRVEKCYVALDPYSVFPSVLDMWEAGRST
jgi:hypothetical protein